MFFSKIKKRLYKSNCFFIKNKKLWCFNSVFFKKRIMQKRKKGQ